MQERPAFERDPFLRTLETKVLETGLEEGRPWAVLEDTLFYPEGGGQPSDRGKLGEASVERVEKREGRILHFLDRPVEKGPVRCLLDWERRWDHMQQHTAQHLLTALAADRFGWKTRAFHLGPEVCDIDLDAPSLSVEEKLRLEEEAAREVAAARPIRVRYVDPGELSALQVRTRGLPEGHRGPVRLVEIEGMDLNTCGGTHLPDTARIGVIALLGTEPMRGGTRLYFVAGERARRRLRGREEAFARLRSLLGAADEEIPGAVQARLERIKALEKERKRLVGEAARLHGEALAGGEGGLAEGHFPEGDGQFLFLVSKAAFRKSPGKVLFLTAGGEGKGFFLLAAGPEWKGDLGKAGAEAARIMEGRGGGKGNAFQGKVAGFARREEALDAVRRILGGEG
ncbi:MAG TPA: hypothetical protein ENJ97_04460 [Planctomycetes bacterium]|nr:hypothetical protein [Planctomycetota bacterium]